MSFQFLRTLAVFATTVIAAEFILAEAALAFELISHKGVHQSRSLQSRSRGTHDCPPGRFEWSGHYFIENTLPAISEAFRQGANVVEIDVQQSRDNEIVLFHDAHLGCLTGIDRAVNQLNLRELKRLDVAGGYSFRSYKSNPLRGAGIGLALTLDELLASLPGRRWVLNPKVDNDAFLRRLGDLLEVHEKKGNVDLGQTRMWGSDKSYHYLKKRFPHFGDRLSHMTRSLECHSGYKAYGWMGVVHPSCRDVSVVVDKQNLAHWDTWGGALGFVQLLHLAGIKVFIMNVKGPQEWKRYWSLGYDGVIASQMIFP